MLEWDLVLCLWLQVGYRWIKEFYKEATNTITTGHYHTRCFKELKGRVEEWISCGMWDMQVKFEIYGSGWVDIRTVSIDVSVDRKWVVGVWGRIIRSRESQDLSGQAQCRKVQEGGHLFGMLLLQVMPLTG